MSEFEISSFLGASTRLDREQRPYSGLGLRLAPRGFNVLGRPSWGRTFGLVSANTDSVERMSVPGAKPNVFERDPSRRKTE